MKKIKVLLWGIYSPWIMNFIENFLLKNNCEIWIPNRGDKKEYKTYIDFYKAKGIHLIEFSKEVCENYKRRENVSFLEKCYYHLKVWKEVLKYGPYDLIHMQYVDYLDLSDVIILKNIMGGKLILSFWGSDLLRVGKKTLSFIGKASRFADFVTFDNKDLEIKFKEVYKCSRKVPLKTVLFGLPVLDIINRTCYGQTIADIRKKWGIVEDKAVIAIGYNGIPAQQHKKVLGAIEKLDAWYKDRIILLLQMSYGGDKAYQSTVIRTAEKTGCEYIAIQHFLSDEEVAELRILTDIFINGQVTDAFSGSVCENLFSGALLMNAKWLHYKELDRYGFRYLEFETFEEMNQLIELAFEKKIDTSINKDLIWQLRSWQYCAPKWDKVYRRVCKDWKKQQ